MKARRLLDVLYPPVAFIIAAVEIRHLGPASSSSITPDGDIAIALIDSIYDSENRRRERLEDKLSGLFGYVSFLIPLALTSLGLGIRDCLRVVVVLSTLALIYLLPAFALVLTGSRARAVYVVNTDTLQELAGESLPGQAERISAAKLAAVDGNLPLSWSLNNALSAARGSVVWAVVFLSPAIAIALVQGSGRTLNPF